MHDLSLAAHGLMPNGVPSQVFGSEFRLGQEGVQKGYCVHCMWCVLYGTVQLSIDTVYRKHARIISA
jgi:hypothetical protein